MEKFIKAKWLEPPHSIEYGTVPSNWVEESNGSLWVCWPKVVNVKPLILSRQILKKDWSRFILLKKYGSGSSFSECEMIPSANDTNEDTDDENLLKRKNRFTLPYFMSDDDFVPSNRTSMTKKKHKVDLEIEPECQSQVSLIKSNTKQHFTSNDCSSKSVISYDVDNTSASSQDVFQKNVP
ncbi:uncharacterized protein LOC136086725 [Hydra vulgaris]|uniref:Uncharacterized protein LOC136086725 n=1 Tax=Hydra vulgaris TaxID=6087 RepID=A0ABM4CT96_HYDVU